MLTDFPVLEDYDHPIHDDFWGAAAELGYFDGQRRCRDRPRWPRAHARAKVKWLHDYYSGHPKSDGHVDFSRRNRTPSWAVALYHRDQAFGQIHRQSSKSILVTASLGRAGLSRQQ